MPAPSDREKEQIKLTATYFNGIAIGFFLVGGLSIPASIFLSATTPLLQGAAIAVGLSSALLSPYVHRVARKYLEKLDG